jgi:hypothetical protein
MPRKKKKKTNALLNKHRKWLEAGQIPWAGLCQSFAGMEARFIDVLSLFLPDSACGVRKT